MKYLEVYGLSSVMFVGEEDWKCEEFRRQIRNRNDPSLV
jgi:hypothetical protein